MLESLDVLKATDAGERVRVSAERAQQELIDAKAAAQRDATQDVVH